MKIFLACFLKTEDTKEIAKNSVQKYSMNFMTEGQG